MILLKRRRLIFWLIRAYFKKWRKTIFASFVFGLIIFFAIYFGWGIIVPQLPLNQHEVIGMVGNYTTDNLPTQVVNNISYGLTQTSENGTPEPAAAKSWQIKDNGKTYIFNLKHNLYFTDGKNLTSDLINYNFIDVSVQRPDKYTIVFRLKEAYSPFLVTVSNPIFENGLTGLGNYKVESLDLNGDFLNSITLASTKVKNSILAYQFYPTQEALKNAFVIGDIDKAIGLNDINYRNTSFKNFVNASTQKSVDYDHLVTIFYNTQDKVLSDKRLREALTYATPDNFSEGERNFGPYSPQMWAYQVSGYQRDYAHAKLLLSQSPTASHSAITITLQTLPQFQNVAQEVANSWKNIGINTNIVVVETLPSNFQAFLGDFTMPKDPDQYTLWHSSQMNNISNYKNLRIDKLLEDGRQTEDIKTRIQIYSDFQKYLLDDAPATFLYFPYSYTVKRNSAQI